MTTRRAFYSFHYEPDHARAGQVRNMGVIEGNAPATDNDWESVKRGGDAAIRRWINDQLSGRSCTIVLIGAKTANRKWINYEIERSWAEGKGIFGVHVHRLKDLSGNQTDKGSNPFACVTVNGIRLDGLVSVYNPPHSDSKDAYAYIKNNLATWIETAIKQRT